MALILVQLDTRIELAQLAVDQHPQKTLMTQIGEQFLVTALASLDHRRQQVETRPRRQRGDLVLDVGQGPAGRRQCTVGAHRHRATAVQQPQKIVDLRDGADRRARAGAQSLLVDGQCRRKPFDAVDVGFGQLVEKLVRVTR